jgi:hypothetical protein
MAEGTSTGCGCNPVQTKQVNPDYPVGSDWTEIVQTILQDGGKRAQEHLETLDEPGEGEVVMRVAMSAFLRFPHKGKELTEEGLVGCVCTNDGVVCVCIGQCDFDACCDPPPAGPIVA